MRDSPHNQTFSPFLHLCLIPYQNSSHAQAISHSAHSQKNLRICRVILHQQNIRKNPKNLTKQLEPKNKLCYSKNKEEQPPTKWLASRDYIKPAQTAKYKVGLFLFSLILPIYVRE